MAAAATPWALLDATMPSIFVVLLVVLLICDMEQYLIDPKTYPTVEAVAAGASVPLWPPEPMVRLLHWFGENYDPLVLARPLWFRTAILSEMIVQLPFYVAAIYAWPRRLNWIRVPAIVFAVESMTVIVLIIAESHFGEQYRTRRPLEWFSAYFLWIVVPPIVLWRCWSGPLFPEKAKSG